MSRDLLELMEQSERDGGIWLEDVPADKLVEVDTQNGIYRIAAIDAATGLVAVDSTGPIITTSALWRLVGSTFGGSAIRLRWIGINMHLELWSVAEPRQVLTTSSIRTIRFLDQPEKAKELIEAANKNIPR